MPHICAVFGCSSNKDKNRDLIFHRFPNEETLRLKWINCCERDSKKDKFNPKNARICGLHFEQNTHERNLKYELLNIPIPSNSSTMSVPTWSQVKML